MVHHTQCGTGLLADTQASRRQAAKATGLAEAELEAAAVADPHRTVKADVERLLASPLLSPKVRVYARPRVRRRDRARHHRDRHQMTCRSRATTPSRAGAFRRALSEPAHLIAANASYPATETVTKTTVMGVERWV